MNNNLTSNKSNNSNFFVPQSSNATKITILKSPNRNSINDIDYFVRKLYGALRMAHNTERCTICQKEQFHKELQTESMLTTDYIYHLTRFLAGTGITPNTELVTELLKDREKELTRIRASSKS